jgi:phospholipid/cholesterol/gamma-HCH transport system substrate-binding protein
MEIKANHVLIGAFTLIVTLATVIFLTWLGQFTFDQKFDEYAVSFSGGVSGLEVGAEVRYSGIKVGEVTSVSLDQTDPSRVNVRFRVSDGTPIKTDTVATIDVGILTGVGIIQLSGGTAQSGLLVAEPGQSYPQVKAGQTDFQAIAEGAPSLFARVNNLVDRANAVMSAPNRQALATILQDVAALTTTVANRKGEIDQMIVDAGGTLADVRKAAARLDTVLADAQSVSGDVREAAGPALKNIESAAANVAELAASLQISVNDLRVPLRDFARGGLPQLVLFIQEARELSQSLDRLVAKLESNPGGFILGTDTPTYQPKGGR